MSPQAAQTVFHFKAALADGTVSTGQLAAANAQQALLLLRQSGARPIRLETKPIGESWLHRDIGWGGSKTLSDRDAAEFCRELHVLVSAGLELPDALSSMLASGSKRSKSWRFVTAVLQGIRLGKGFAAAVEQSGFRVPSDVVPTLSAAEDAGALPISLEALATSLGERGKLASSVLTAMAYPAFLLVVVAIVLTILATFVAPALGRLFISMDKPLPPVIALLWGSSEFVAQNGAALALASVIAVGLVIAVFRSRAGRQAMLAIVRRLPLLGGIVTWSATSRFAATLRLSISTHVVLADALERALGAAGSLPEARIARALAQIRRGATLEQALGQVAILPPKAMHLIAIGERGGRLEEVLGIISEDARLQLERRTVVLNALLGPVLIVFVGIIVGLAVYSVFSALMEVNSFAS